MSHKKMTAGKLAAAAEELFRTRGYHNTSISDIAKFCNLSKASLYHHVSSKKQLAILAIHHVHDFFREHVFKAAFDENYTPQERLTKVCEALREYYYKRSGGCLIGSLALEIDQTDADFTQLFQEFFNDWILAFATIFSKEKGLEQANINAKQIVSMIQGTIMISSVFQDNDMFLNFLNKYVQKEGRLD